MDNNFDFYSQSVETIEVIKELETLIRDKFFYGDDSKNLESMYKEIENQRPYNAFKKELIIARKTRNIIVHNKYDEYKGLIANNIEIINKLKKLIELIKYPPKAIETDMVIKYEKICKKSLNDNVIATMKEMKNNIFTHIPIVQNNKVIGVFSENTLFDIFLNGENIIIDESINFGDINEYLHIENHTLEEFVFKSENATIYDIEKDFENYFSNSKRLGCIFITDNGKNTGNLKGMVTAWDVLGKS